MSGAKRFSPTKAAALRRKLGLSVEHVAGKALRSEGWLRDVESGARVPTADELADLIYALGADFSAVITMHGKPLRQGAAR